MSIIIFIIILALLVLVHEYGHFIFAKRAGVRVDEFGIGYPPKAKTLFKRGETTFTLNWLPFGGFVKIFGENPADVDPNGPDVGRSLISKSKWTQASILFAGVFFNFILGFILLSLAFTIGVPTSVSEKTNIENIKDISLRVVSVAKDSPASEAFLKSGDKIISISTENAVWDMKSTGTLKAFVLENNNSPLSVKYEQSGVGKQAILIPKETEEGQAKMIGLAIDKIGTESLPIHMAFVEGFKMASKATGDIVVVIGGLVRDLFVGKPDLTGITGPVGIVGAVGDAATFGFSYLLTFAALISLNLAVINLIPFPALDGGRLFFLLIESIIKRPIPAKVSGIVNTIGFGLLLLLMVVVTFRDVKNLF